ncbi:hypothetical protein BGX31_002198 [Mortierella sp. GBA43]|nr:hypothetical protein BGX31_002198 [Mortierella sp. GBA43]
MDKRKQPAVDGYHLNDEQRGNLVAIAQKVVGAAQDNRAASIVFPLYRKDEASFNRCLEMIYHFARRLEKFPTSATTEATFVIHAVANTKRTRTTLALRPAFKSDQEPAPRRTVDP